MNTTFHIELYDGFYTTFVPLKGFEHRYSICEEGFVYDWKRDMYITGCDALTRGGKCYRHIHLTDQFGKHYTKQVHRLVAEHFIPNPENKACIDHLDGNGLNNSRENLRWATHAENSQNRKPNKNGTSKFMGVSWHTPLNKWYVQININGKKKNLGYYSDELEAAKAYDIAAIEAGYFHHNGLLVQ